MEKLIAALFLFGVTGLVAISAVPNKAAALRSVLHWLLGFFCSGRGCPLRPADRI